MSKKKKSVSFDGGPVGYKRPPAEHQFKKGQRPPASGRKKGSKNYSTLVPDFLHSKVGVMMEGKHRKIPRKEALLLRAAMLASTGNVIDICRFFDLAERLDPNAIKDPQIIRFQKIEGDDW